jgi:hypothetical protein
MGQFKEQSPCLYGTSIGIRSVEVPSELASMLAKFAGERTDFLFSNGNGKPLNESTARSHLAKQRLQGDIRVLLI